MDSKNLVFLFFCFLMGINYDGFSQKLVFENNQIQLNISLFIQNDSVKIETELLNKGGKSIYIPSYLSGSISNYSTVNDNSIDVYIGWDQQSPQEGIEFPLDELKGQLIKKYNFTIKTPKNFTLQSFIVGINYCLNEKKLEKFKSIELTEYLKITKWEEFTFILKDKK